MAITIKAQVLQDATQLVANLTQAKQNLDAKAPLALVQEMHSLSLDAERLTELQKKVGDTFKRGQNAIPNVTEDELLAISEKLSLASDLLDGIEANNTAAQDILMISFDVQDLFSGPTLSPSLQAVKDLQARVTTVNYTPNLTAGNKSALQQMTHTLALTAEQLSAPQTAPASRQTVPAPRQPSPAAPSSQNNSAQTPIQQQRVEIANQNAAYEATLALDQAKDLDKELKELVRAFNGRDPVAEFDKLIAAYNAAFNKFKGSNLLSHPQAKDQLERTLRATEVTLEHMIDAQKKIELQQGLAAQAQQFPQQSGGSGALQGLKTALEKAVKEVSSTTCDPLALNKTVNDAFAALGSEDKAKLFQALNQQLKDEKKITKDIPPALQRLGIQQWSGGYDMKLKALLRIMPATPQTAPAPAQTAPVVKKADEMQRRYDALPSIFDQITAPQNSSSVTPSNPQNRQSSVQVEDEFNMAEFEQQIAEPATVAAMKSFQTILSLLQDESSTDDLQNALTQLFYMESNGDKGNFQISGNSSLIADRPCFHLYFIHKNAGNQLPNDAKYGNNAMIGIHPTTNEDRRRAFTRTIAELALENLDDAVNVENAPAIVEMLGVLENIQIAPSDLPNGVQNIAYGLFGQMYQQHVNARQGNQSLIDPNDGQFKGDFGRHAFSAIMNGIDPAIKLGAISEMRKALKAAWKV